MFVVYAKFNHKWIRIKAFEKLEDANKEMREQVFLFKAEAASVEKED